jgi:predicted transcriptional regulator
LQERRDILNDNTSVEDIPSEKPEEINKFNPIDISNLISNRNVSMILMCSYKKPISVHQISELYNIPIAVCYRKVNELEKLGFIRCTDKVLTRKGKRVRLYQSQIVYAHFFYEKGKFRARVQLSSGIVDDYGGSWSYMNKIPE